MQGTPRRAVLGRLAVTGLATLAFVAGAPAVASAGVSHTTSKAWAHAGHAGFHVRVSFVGDDGRAYYRDTIYFAGPRGAGIRNIESRAG